MTTRLTEPAPAWTTLLWVILGATSAGWALGWLGVHVSHDDHPRWLLARISGLVAIALMTGLVSVGLALAHPRGTAFRSVSRGALISVHIGLAAFTAVFTVLHVVVLATDEHAGVGWIGLLLPMRADYRPMPITLGWIALYGGLAAGLTARFAGLVGRAWWPIHRIAIVAYAAAWLHGVLTGTDSAALTLMYAASMLVVLSVAASRYLTAPIRVAGGQR